MVTKHLLLLSTLYSLLRHPIPWETKYWLKWYTE